MSRRVRGVAHARRRLLAGCAALALAGCNASPSGGNKEPSFSGVDITGTGIARSLALADPDGRPRTLADWKGKVVVVFFGYTQCPDVCPTTMAELAQVKQALGPSGDRLQVIFVTVDPERDTSEILKRYMASFDPSFVALRGTPEETAAAAKEFKLYYAKVPGRRGDGSYTIDHTAGSFVFDALGRARLFVRFGGDGAALKHDLQALLAAS